MYIVSVVVIVKILIMKNFIFLIKTTEKNDNSIFANVVDKDS